MPNPNPENESILGPPSLSAHMPIESFDENIDRWASSCGYYCKGSCMNT